jgi:hypothetical protein
MTKVEISFYGLSFFAFLSAIYGVKRYRTPLNPLTIFAVVQIGLFTIVSGIVAIIIPVAEYNSSDVIMTIGVSFIYLGAVTLPYLFHKSMLIRVYGKGLMLLGLSSDQIAMRLSPAKLILLLGGAASSLLALAIFGGGGMLWLANTREAYIIYRAGAGPFFLLTQWFLMCALLYYIWATKPQILRLFMTLFFFSVITYFLGSKNNIIVILIVGITYYHFYIKRVPLMIFPLLVLLILSELALLLIIQGSYQSLLEVGLYFRDYFDTTAQFLSRFEEFGFHYGQGWLSSFWFYIPRGFYQDKPYEYGFTLIHKVLFPGAAEIGNTPGLLEWSLVYMDFGVAGVFVYGLIIGIWQKISYEYFLKHKQKFFAFVFCLQFAIWPIWPFAPIVFVTVLSIILSIFLRLVWRRNRLKPIRH